MFQKMTPPLSRDPTDLSNLQLPRNLAGWPSVRAQAIQRNTRPDRHAARVGLGAAPPAKQRRETLRPTVAPIELRRQVVDPSLAHPFDRVPVELLVLIDPSLDARRNARHVDPERTHAKLHARPFGVHHLAHPADERIDIVPAPVGSRKRAASRSIRGVGGIVGERIHMTAVGRIRIKIIVEMNACDIVSLHDDPERR